MAARPARRADSTTVPRMTAPDATPDALTDSLAATRTAYDAAATTYAQLFRDSLREAPLDRAMLAAFAEAVRGAGPDARVADLGCGPGHVTAHLAGLGLVPRGFDVSPAMIGLARAAHPELRFDVSSMAGLDLPDATLSGVLSRWSVIHTPPAELPPVLAEFARILAPGGQLLLGFWASESPGHRTQVFDHAVAPAYRWCPDHLSALLREAGLTETARMIREPQPTDRRQFRQVHLLAHRPDVTA
ncbi:SAM-dependent methyltransferase [Streptomyces albidoflavus]|nr:SAM-dependent methyltransferase [Streptomyces albidoflavus]PAX92485.1 SAM-dependent methyltransferase [Streptomyces albidoflavus]PBO24833.1 SAM-dependent methyltransferase [Streptomyces albidoflavus]PBO28001.1 SAM-dependent methyltransferase [Streptomyces albidoflavus]